MACDPEILKNVPLFALLDAEEIAVLATQVELKTFAARERIYKKEQPGGQAYVLLSGQVRVTTVDEDQQEVIVDEPSAGEFFGFASMLEQTAHHTSAIAIDETRCVEVSRDDIAVLLQRKPLADMDLLTALSRQFRGTLVKPKPCVVAVFEANSSLPSDARLWDESLVGREARIFECRCRSARRS
jgi:CRP/FNR family transcriptional regulator, cyclic AMP receptor protein